MKSWVFWSAQIFGCKVGQIMSTKCLAPTERDRATFTRNPKQDILKSHKGNLYIRDNGNFCIILPEKYIATLSTLAELRLWNAPFVSATRVDNFLLIELFQVSLVGFQKFFLFWVAGMILEAWDVELESANSFVYYVYFKAVCHEICLNYFEFLGIAFEGNSNF